jgi:hypothetical protein
MAPAQTRKRKSEAIETEAQHTTPTGSPARKKTKITQSQKQALIDNLQLEITERARGLRAHFALQCADLRARVERRINRIPMALRKAKMGDLLEKHSQQAPSKTTNTSASQAAMAAILPLKSQERPLPFVPRSPTTKLPSPIRSVQQPLSSTPRGKKRKTSDIVIAADKESEAEQKLVQEDKLPVQKNPKRAKTATGARNVSRTNQPGSVLSPKSHNSRTLPQSPIKDYKVAPSSPSKPSYYARPVSPLKPASPLKTVASAATSAISASFHGMMEHAKRNGNPAGPKVTRTASQEKTAAAVSSAMANGGKMLPPPRPNTARSASAQSTNSSGSGTSTTTVVKKAGTGLRAAVKGGASKKVAPAPKASAMKSGATAVSAQGKKVVVAEPAAGRRVLRKRN